MKNDLKSVFLFALKKFRLFFPERLDVFVKIMGLSFFVATIFTAVLLLLAQFFLYVSIFITGLMTAVFLFQKEYDVFNKNKLILKSIIITVKSDIKEMTHFHHHC